MYRRILTLFSFLLVVGVSSSFGQDSSAGIDVPAVIENGDTIPFETLKQVWVYPNPFDVARSQRKRKIFWRIVRDVKKTLPYSKMIAEEVAAIDLATMNMSEKDRKAYMKSHEDELVDKFKPELKNLSLRQGKMLIKLVDRQCGKTSYELVKDYRGTVRAVFWQGFASIFGASLKSGFSKEEDEVIEYVINMIENGQL